MKIRKLLGKGNWILVNSDARRDQFYSHAWDNVGHSWKDLLSC